MKYVLLAILVLVCIGCVGSPNPHNPMDKGVATVTSKLWWQKDTSQMTKDENPWEKFVIEQTPVDWSNPWGDYQEPRLFPENWKHEDKGKLEEF